MVLIELSSPHRYSRAREGGSKRIVVYATFQQLRSLAPGCGDDTLRSYPGPFICDFYAHYRPIVHRLAAMHNAVDRQSDRNRPPIYLRIGAAAYCRGQDA